MCSSEEFIKSWEKYVQCTDVKDWDTWMLQEERYDRERLYLDIAVEILKSAIASSCCEMDCECVHTILVRCARQYGLEGLFNEVKEEYMAPYVEPEPEPVSVSVCDDGLPF